MALEHISGDEIIKDKSPTEDDEVGKEVELLTKDGEVEDGKKSEIEGDTEVPDEIQNKDKSSPQKRKCGIPFWERLLKRTKIRKANSAHDPETGTELLAKDGRHSMEVEEENNKHEKTGSGTDVTIALTDQQDADGHGNNQREKKQTPPTHSKNYWRRVVIGLVLIVFVLIAVSLTSILTNSPNRQARYVTITPLTITECGKVHGILEDDAVTFKGIPYSLQPVEARRWKQPEAFGLSDCWSGVYMANETVHCYQNPIPGQNVSMSESCLHVTIHTPGLSYNHPFPVIVYIPGISLQGYGPEDILWQPSAKLAKEKEVVFVTVNYRTNVFGFMTLDILSKRVHPPTSGNYGFMDQIAALNWVQKNIRDFGGDPNKVTLLGHGSGATSALVLFTTRKTTKLFHQMWITGPSAKFSDKALEEVQKENDIFLRKLNCETVECLLEKDVDELLDATPSSWSMDLSGDLPSDKEDPYPSVIARDGVLLFDVPSEMWPKEKAKAVTVVVGATAQESGSSVSVPDVDTWNWINFSDHVSEKLSSLNSNITSSVLEYYLDNSSSPQVQFHSMVSDIRVICPVQKLVYQLDEVLDKDVFSYIVNYRPSEPIQMSNFSSPAKMAVHGIDIVAIFGLLDKYLDPLTEKDMKYQTTMQDLFYSFVHGGIPESGGSSLKAATYVNMVSDVISSRPAPYENCKLWEEEHLFSTYARMN